MSRVSISLCHCVVVCGHCKMEDVNTTSRKRKMSSSDVIDLSLGDESLENSQEIIELDNMETDTKIQHLDSHPSQTSESNLECVSLTSSDSNAEVIEGDNLRHKLLQLEDELKQLKTENEELKSQTCLCKKVQTNNEFIAAIKFTNLQSFHLHKDKLTKSFKDSIDLDVEEDETNLLIVLLKDIDIDSSEWVVVNECDITKAFKRPHKKKKQPKSKSTENDVKIVEDKQEEHLFVLDTTPWLGTSNNLRYESKFTVTDESETDKKKVEEKSNTQGSQSCFNCGENHTLRDCSKPKNHIKINMARQKFKTQNFNRTVRYHLEEDQKYSHLKPGKISSKLQFALGLHRNELPEYIYKMRRLGYPPGWLDEMCESQSSELVVFDFEGKGDPKKKIKSEVNEEKVIEYPGFNVPPKKGIRDEHTLYGCPSFSKECSKDNMLNFIKNFQKKCEDNLETCDMDLDNASSDKEVVEIVSVPPKKEEMEVENCSPTLIELECEKQKLLAELDENVDSNLPEGFKTLDSVGLLDDMDLDTKTLNGTIGDDSISQSKLIKESSFGTPIIKSSTPYCKLPEPEKFSQNVSQVINFENLPNSTGKYEQMISVLQKVRKTLKNLNEENL